jgi:hypothetical protein
MRQGDRQCPALRACDSANLSVVECSVDDFGFAVSISEAARVLLQSSRLSNLTHGVFSCVDKGTNPFTRSSRPHTLGD